MNKDNIKSILDKLNIEIKDSWHTIHKFKNITLTCYYHQFYIGDKMYIVSGDGNTYVLTDENPFNYIYAGFELKELKNTIKELYEKAILFVS